MDKYSSVDETHAIRKFKIGLCQLSVTSDKNDNIEMARDAIEYAADQGASLVVLPEMWNCPYSDELFAKFAEDFDEKDRSPTLCMLSEVASLRGVTVVGGSIPECCGDLLYNTCFVFGPNGNLMAKHRKIHLFDFSMPGGISFKESDSFRAGDTLTIVDTDVGRIGVGICHDLRFSELAMLYRARGAQLICYPGAFNVSTGEALWELEQRARAADNQLYVATCSPSRQSAGSYEIWGHSSLAGPSGEIVATCGHEETTVIAEVDYSTIQRWWESLSIQKQRREDIYQLISMHKHQKSL